jgi:hypothetical protein
MVFGPLEDVCENTWMMEKKKKRQYSGRSSNAHFLEWWGHDRLAGTEGLLPFVAGAV